MQQDLKSSIVNRKCLIVGCGYIGLALGAELVRQGRQVFGLRRSAAAANELEAANIQPLIADITKPQTLTKLPRDFDWVVNCAASAGGNLEDYRKTYLEGNRNLMAWLAGSPLQRLVYTSSTSVYGQNDGSIVTEQSPVEPEADTAKVLVAAEKLLLGSWERRHPAGETLGKSRQDAGAPSTQQRLPTVILRVAGIYGPGRGQWFKQFLRGEARIEGNGSRWLNMIHREDVVGAILAALERGKPGQIYNAVDNKPVTQLKFFGWLATELQRPLPHKIPAGDEIRRRRSVTNKRVSNSKLRTELKYEFKFPDFRAGYSAEIAKRSADGSSA